MHPWLVQARVICLARLVPLAPSHMQEYSSQLALCASHRIRTGLEPLGSAATVAVTRAFGPSCKSGSPAFGQASLLLLVRHLLLEAMHLFLVASLLLVVVAFPLSFSASD